jgi:hypothetical protein
LFLFISIKSTPLPSFIESRLGYSLNSISTQEATEPATAISAWTHDVNSNNLLGELRGLTNGYPFGSECLDEAKWLVLVRTQDMYMYILVPNIP